MADTFTNARPYSTITAEASAWPHASTRWYQAVTAASYRRRPLRIVGRFRAGRVHGRVHFRHRRAWHVPEDYEHRHVKGGLYLARPKSEDSWRIIPLVDPLRSILARYMRAYPSTGLVFTRPDGNPHDPKDDTAEWRRVLERAGIDKDVRLHDLRHTAVLLLRAAGVDWDVIKLILGHATIAQSMAYLPAAEANDPRMHAAMEAVSALFVPKEIAA